MFDTMAIDAAQVPTMKSAIQTYIEDVNAKMDAIKSYSIGSEEGVYGSEQVQTIDSYIDDTCDKIKSIVTYFDVFEAALDEVAAAYDAKQAGSSVTAAAENKAPDAADLININRMD